MTELTRFKIAIDNDMDLRSQYLKLLDRLMTDGEVTPEMTSVAAKKLGFDISAEEFKREKAESQLSEDELETVGGGLNGRWEYAPDGKMVGCPYNFYFTWTDYWILNENSYCPCGGVHKPDDRDEGRICLKCRLALDERGVINCYDKNGREIK